MTNENILIISRYHSKEANAIYESYMNGIEYIYPSYHYIDYFDMFTSLGKRETEKEIFNILEKKSIQKIFLIFVSGDPSFDPNFLHKLSKKYFIIMVFWDMEQFFEQIDRYYAQVADLVLLSANYEYGNRLRLINVESLATFSIFDSKNYKNLEVEKDIDVSFIGEVNKGKRKEYLKFLEDNGINIQSYGVGTKNGKVSFEKVIEIFNRSKINLSFTGTYSNTKYSYGLRINDRILQNKGKPIEIAMCGGFVLSEQLPGLEKVFPNNEVDTFEDKYDLLNKVKYYLNNYENITKEKAYNGYKYALGNYDSINAFKKVKNKIDSISKKTSNKLILDNTFIKIHNTFNFFYFLEFIGQKKYKLAKEYLYEVIKYRKLNYKDIYKYLKYKFFVKQKLKIIKNKLEKITSNNEQLIIYGAGVHTYALFKIYPQLISHTLFIVDKDSRLWGNKIYKKEIRGLESIENNSSILISSFNFQEEIKQYLLNTYNQNVKIYTIYDKRFKKDVITSQIKTDPYQNYVNSLN